MIRYELLRGDGGGGGGGKWGVGDGGKRFPFFPLPSPFQGEQVSRREGVGTTDHGIERKTELMRTKSHEMFPF